MSSPFILSQAEAESRAGDSNSEVPRGAFAGQLCYILAMCWYMALCVSTLAVPVLGCPVEQRAGRQQELPGAPADPMAECLGSGMLSVLGTGTPMALAEAAPQCPDCPCPHGLREAELLFPLGTQVLVWEVGSRHSSEAPAEYTSILSHICLTEKTVETNV